MCELTIRRAEARRDRLRRYKIVIDGAEVGSVKCGSAWSGRVATGRHYVEMRIAWKSSPAIEINAARGQTIDLVCGPTGGAVDGLAQIFMPGDRYLFLRPARNSSGEVRDTDDEPARVGDFSVATETGWDPPSRSSGVLNLIGTAMDAASGGGQLPMGQVGEPRWRVVLHDGDTEIAASAWYCEWSDVERLKAEWTSRVRAMDPSEIRATAQFWE